jgi:hypothetical protein
MVAITLGIDAVCPDRVLDGAEVDLLVDDSLPAPNDQCTLGELVIPPAVGLRMGRSLNNDKMGSILLVLRFLMIVVAGERDIMRLLLHPHALFAL